MCKWKRGPENNSNINVTVVSEENRCMKHEGNMKLKVKQKLLQLGLIVVVLVIVSTQYE